MPFDAFFLTAVRRELEGSLTGCRIDKVQQPQRDTLILSMRGAAGGGRLLLTASPNHPRIHLTNEPAENPAQPPMFCMLLRKHLTGGRLVSMQQVLQVERSRIGLTLAIHFFAGLYFVQLRIAKVKERLPYSCDST